MILRCSSVHIETAANQNHAFKLLDEMNFDLAFLDVNLKNSTSLDFSQKCYQSGIEFVYLTGYGTDFLEDQRFPRAAVLIKPVQASEIEKIMYNSVKHSKE